MWAYLTGAKGASGYGSATTAEEVAAAHAAELAGKVVLVTGGNSGIGLETCRVLALHGATVYVGARSAARAEEAIAAIRATVPSAPWQLRAFVADLGSLASIRAGVDAFLAENVPLHVLINNAGMTAAATACMQRCQCALLTVAYMAPLGQASRRLH
jgi:WW domain-containing oxidoreductase